ncbi:MAG: rsmI [Gammaproteobacteria bacterium]|jgi:16S rRNA (cytidine1402-2'-O)-methyltransferase|nr:rsmI [Gammaproteobacteria bacterium]
MMTSGILYIVATPIGNLADMTFRAVQVLQTVDLIAAEDTRHSRPLLQHYGIQTPSLSLHAHNEQQRSQELLEKLQQGQKIGLISDAGTPLISDPGFYLVEKARAAGHKVVPIPGVSAVITALSAAGLPTDKFSFEGFLPAKAGARQKRLTELQQEIRTLVFYEAPHRITDLIDDMLLVYGNERYGVIARELTKQFETIQGGSLIELRSWLQADSNQQRGEFVVLIKGCEPLQNESQHEAHEVLKILLAELPVKQAVSLAVKLTGAKKNELYQWALSHISTP